MTTLERPLPLQVVVVALVLCCIGGFAMGLTNAMKLDRGGAVTSPQPLAETSGVPIKDAAPALAYEPPPVEKPKPKAVEVETVEQEAPPPARWSKRRRPRLRRWPRPSRSSPKRRSRSRICTRRSLLPISPANAGAQIEPESTSPLMCGRWREHSNRSD